MFPPVFETCSADGVVQSLLAADGIVRVFEFGEALQGTLKPYAVWQQVFGAPENYLDKTPDMDVYGVQMDVYADSAVSARAVIEALRDAIEPVAHITSWNGEYRDLATRTYRISFTVDWFVPR